MVMAPGLTPALTQQLQLPLLLLSGQAGARASICSVFQAAAGTHCTLVLRKGRHWGIQAVGDTGPARGHRLCGESIIVGVGGKCFPHHSSGEGTNL